ncbi:histidine phosphatase family protein [Arthrobacter sp. NQ7]|uniref:histidine phosphatase family protein n=1 Tax=Arthrobacter sp. NQ7 TaxID=3032303 RepID=UPI00240F6E54|nr:histidine phosphatase family protein [Arthrobacter sp. NQ7]MDJ0457968.1 histidine phosphatase family protein [Arthrobacter sp. NQ7]
MTVPENGVRHLYLARHGQTALNAEGRLRGLADPPLDAAGEAEARRLAEALAAKGSSIVISSPLQRAVHTAAAIAKRAGVAHVVDERFNDRDYGPQTGRLKTEVIAQWGSVDDAPGVESARNVLARVRPALDAVLDENPEGSVIVVTHEAVIRPLIASLAPAWQPELSAPTGSWNDLCRAGADWTIVAADQTPAG